METGDLNKVANPAIDNILNPLSTADLLRLISELPNGYRTVFNLYAIEGFSHQEIANQLGISESTSKTQYLKAKNKLQIQLEKLETPASYDKQ